MKIDAGKTVWAGNRKYKGEIPDELAIKAGLKTVPEKPRKTAEKKPPKDELA